MANCRFHKRFSNPNGSNGGCFLLPHVAEGWDNQVLYACGDSPEGALIRFKEGKQEETSSSSWGGSSFILCAVVKGRLGFSSDEPLPLVLQVLPDTITVAELAVVMEANKESRLQTRPFLIINKNNIKPEWWL